jgi:hypothetical protein
MRHHKRKSAHTCSHCKVQNEWIGCVVHMQRLVGEIKQRFDNEVVESSSIAGSTRAVIGRGAVVREVLLEGEFIRIFFSKVPTWDKLIASLSSGGFPEFAYQQCMGESADQGFECGIVTFKRKEDARIVRRAFQNGFLVDGCMVTARSCVELSPGSQVWKIHREEHALHDFEENAHIYIYIYIYIYI